MEATVDLKGTYYFRDTFPQLARKSKLYGHSDQTLRKIFAGKYPARVFMYQFPELPAEIRPDAHASSEYTLLPVFIGGKKVGYIPEDFHKTYFSFAKRITGVSARIRGGPCKSVAEADVCETDVFSYSVRLTISYV